MVGWVSSIPADRSQTHASPPVWLATTLSSRNRTGSERAFSLTANSAAASAVSGSRANGATAHFDTSVNDNFDFGTRRY